MAMDTLTEVRRSFAELTGYSEPNPMQLAMWEAIAVPEHLGVGLLLKGPTGSGKTEAVAVPAIATGRRLIMVYPTRSLVDDQVTRFGAMLQRWSAEQSGHPVTLTIDTGAQSHRYVYRDGHAEHAAGNASRHLYHGDVIITTLDKFLYRFFGYGEPKKAYTFPLRINYGLKDALICFDEAHSYDAVAFTNFSRLVRILYERGRDLVLMTATMPEAKQKRHLDFLEVVDYVEDDANATSLTAHSRQVSNQTQYPERVLKLLPVEIAEDVDPENNSLVDALIDEASANIEAGRRMIVTAERVEDAVLVWRALKQRFADRAPVLLYHGRLSDEQRRKVYSRLKDIDSADGDYLLVSTSAIEVGCDLDAHVLITQLCDPDRLVQRIGRCNRRKRIAGALVVVVGNSIPAWLTSLEPLDFSLYWEELQKQNGSAIVPQPLLACLKSDPRIDYRVEMMFDMLYEYVYDAKLENKPLHDKGFVITRDWEPSFTLYTGVNDKGKLLDAVSVPMRRCKAKSGEAVDNDWYICKRAFSPTEERFVEQPLGRWECAYSVDAIACPTTTLFDFNPEEGWVQLPKLFNYGYTKGYRRVLVREVDDEAKAQLWYIADTQDSYEATALSVQVEAEEPEQSNNSDEDD